MIFFKKNYEKTSRLQIEDYIPASTYQSLLPKYQQFLDKLFENPSAHLEKFLAKIQSNGVLMNREILEMMLDQLFIENQIPIQAYTLENAKSFNTPNLKHASPIAFKFWIELLQELKIWKSLDADETAIYHYFNIIDKMISSKVEPEFSETAPNNSFWKSKLALPEITTFKFLYDQFKNFHSDNIVQAKRPMDLIELFCLLEDAAFSQNLIRISNEHLDFLRALNGSTLLLRAIQIFPAAMPDFIAFQLNEPDCPQIENYAFMADESFLTFFGKHPHLEKFNRLGFFHALGIYLDYHIRLDKKHSINLNFDEQVEVLRQHMLTPDTQVQHIEHFQYLSKRLIFIFNRLTANGYLMRSPILKGLGYHPLINTELPIQFSEYLPYFYQNFQHYPKDLQEELIITALSSRTFVTTVNSYPAQQLYSIEQKF